MSCWKGGRFRGKADIGVCAGKLHVATSLPGSSGLVMPPESGEQRVSPQTCPGACGLVELGAGTGMFLKVSSLGPVLPGFKGSLDLITAQSSSPAPCRGKDAKESPRACGVGVHDMRRMEEGGSGTPPCRSRRRSAVCHVGTGTCISAHSKHFTCSQPSRECKAPAQLGTSQALLLCSALLCSALLRERTRAKAHCHL